MAVVLDKKRVRRLSAVVAIGCALAYVAILARSVGLRFPSGDYAFGDLQCLLTSGKLALAGDFAHLYDPATQAHVQAAMVSPDAKLDLYLSPPFMAFLWAPLSALPYFTAGVVWNAITALLAALAARLTSIALALPAMTIALLVFASEPFWQTLVSGQDSALALVLYAGALLAWRRKKEVVAGVLIGFGAFKPQLFWMVPIAFLAARRFRALGAFVATAAVLGLSSLAIIGWSGAVQYVKLLQSGLYHVQIEAHVAMTVGVPVFAKALFPSIVATIISAIAVVVVAFYVWRGARAEPSRLIGLAALGSMLAAPHGFVYDATILAVALAELYAADPRRATIAIAAVLGITWLIPFTRDFAQSPWPARIIATPWTTVAVGIAFVCYVRSRSQNAKSAPG